MSQRWLFGCLWLAAIGCSAPRTAPDAGANSGTTDRPDAAAAPSAAQPLDAGDAARANEGSAPDANQKSPTTGDAQHEQSDAATQSPTGDGNDPSQRPAYELAVPGVAAPEVLGTLLGPGSLPAPKGPRVYGADLGTTFEHKGVLQIVFGDTWVQADAVCSTDQVPMQDDTMGTLPLKYEGGVPSIELLADANAPDKPALLQLFRGSESLALGYVKAPATAFSDGENLFGIFSRLEPLPCGVTWAQPGEACPDDGRMACHANLGTCQPGILTYSWLCDADQQVGCLPGQMCVAQSYCVDQTSSQFTNTLPLGDGGAVVHSIELGVQRASDPHTFDSLWSWPTNKFSQPNARSVAKFTGQVAGNDYGPGHGALLVWGRPGFSAAHGRESQLYFMTFPLPLPIDTSRKQSLAPSYFAGIDPSSGEPRWSNVQADAKPLALDGKVDGDPHEQLGVVGMSTVSWVGEPINKWVLLYGGDFTDYLLLDPVTMRSPRGAGSIMLRFADYPWGPFSAPVPHLIPGDPSALHDPNGPGGFLYAPDCKDTAELTCAKSDPARPIDAVVKGCPVALDDPGRLYAPNIIDSYTRPNADGGVDMLWNVSSWNPYAVKLLKTRLTPASQRPPSAELATGRALERLADWRSLPVLHEQRRFVQQTSHDRTTDDTTFPLSNHGNRDFNNFLCASKDLKAASDQITPFRFDMPECPESYVHGAVMGRFEGSGQMVRMWLGMASLLLGPADDEVLRIYVDDDPTPRVEARIADVLNGKAGEMFAPPFGAGSGKRMAWYYPVAFNHKLITAIDGLGSYDEYYYHCDVAFEAAATPEALPVERLAVRDQAIDELTNVFRPGGLPDVLHANETLNLAPDAKQSISLTGHGTIQELRVRVAQTDLATLSNIAVAAQWDGADKPAIDVPLLDLFGSNIVAPDRSTQAINSFQENNDQILGLKLPMPFANGAQWTFHNLGSQAIAFNVSVLGDTQPPAAEAGRLHVTRSQTGPTSAPEYVAAQATGRGRFVGACIYVEGHPDPASSFQYDPLNLLEGDVRLSVDGALALDGTGTEEYADDVFYFQDAPHANAFTEAWAVVRDVNALPGHASLCRWHVLGNEIDFGSELKMTFEMGGAGNPAIVDLHRTVAFMYLADQ